ncbi:MAG TPA: DUF4384 domain-containing protein [Albitalea sp.]|uniref:DUF4384 domain-containing protein n=1 Tax=Piscinibacter sp. TaxID=1903157 RepID=UPI002ED1C990
MSTLRLLAAALAMTMAACTAPPRPASLQVQPAASGPKAVPQRNLTHFADGLRCMDDMLYRFGVRDVSLMIEEMQDQSRRLGAGTRDMMVSAFADMTRRSRGVRLVTFGQDNQNIVQLLSMAQRLNDFKVVPQYDIRGSITQFDEDVEKQQAGVGVSLASLFGVRFGRTRQSSVLGFDASVISTADLSLMPGASSKNTIVVSRDESGASEGVAQIRNGSLSFSFGVARNEGVAQSLRNMVELSAIELTGKLLRLPYWSCLNLDIDHPEVRREMEDWFLSIQGHAEMTRFLQEQLRNRKFYDGPMDGKPNPAYIEALAGYREAIGTRREGDLDIEAWRAILLRPIPAPPPRPFVHGKAADSDAMGLSVRLGKPRYRKGEAIELTVSTAQTGYVYCYVQSPSTGKIQRIFPNRFVRESRIEAHAPLVLPGEQGFKIVAGGAGTARQAVACLFAQREIYNEIAPQLRWGDFEDIRLGSFDEIRSVLSQAAKASIALETAMVDVVE